MNGADLVFSSVREKVPSQLYRALLSHQVFEGGPLGKVEKNPNQPIHVPSGQDSFSQIGEPDGANKRSKVSFEQLWQEIIESQFPKAQDQDGDRTTRFLQSMAKYADEKVDNMRRQKDEELEQYRRDIERQKRFEGKQMGAKEVSPEKAQKVRVRTTA